MSADFQNVGEHFRWHRRGSEIEDTRTGTRRHESDFAAKVDVYEDRVRSWFLDVGAQMLKGGACASDYVALAIGLSYVEGVEQYRRGRKAKKRGESSAFFRSSLRRIFPEVSENVADRVWDAVRCGLFHAGFTEGPTLISHERPNAIEVVSGYLYLNPAAFIRTVEEDFTNYVAQLRADNDGDLARRFAELWDQRWSETEPGTATQRVTST